MRYNQMCLVAVTYMYKLKRVNGQVIDIQTDRQANKSLKAATYVRYVMPYLLPRFIQLRAL